MLPLLSIKTWQTIPLTDLAKKITTLSRIPLVLIDGKGGSGKSSFARFLANTLNASLVATDDICWNADPIHWDGEMIQGVITPWKNGETVNYRPSGWIKENRNGFVQADGAKPLIIEGSGACRKSLRPLADYSIWIDTPPDIARARVIERDLANGDNGTTYGEVAAFTDWWDNIVDPFLLSESPWKFVDLIVSGTQSDLVNGAFYMHPSHP